MPGNAFRCATRCWPCCTTPSGGHRPRLDPIADFGNGPGFGTPTVTANGQVVKLEQDWVQKVVRWLL
ncbi:hypothetical protein DMC63_04460 [Streptomyces sp. WAC 05977]|nr:hypothetical protein DMC63_04460 [Streptomyces sp. WAC 05977]